jgi:RNA polymerase II subunit A small phosphatase-like protein
LIGAGNVMDRKLLILDLDETLIFASESPLSNPADFEVGPYCVYRRPHLEEFLTFVRGHFDVAVWTSSSQDYAESVVANVFPKDFPLSFVWDRRRCTPVFDPENWEHVHVKDLRKVKRRGYRLESVIMIDDTPEKLVRHYGNHLRLKAFMGDPQDSELRDVQPFLVYLSEQENFRRIEKRDWRSF